MKCFMSSPYFTVCGNMCLVLIQIWLKDMRRDFSLLPLGPFIFHHYFTCAFFVQNFFAQLSLVTFQLCNFWRQNISAKYASKMLKKLTLENNNYF